jgi:hypothetical protein
MQEDIAYSLYLGFVYNQEVKDIIADMDGKLGDI